MGHRVLLTAWPRFDLAEVRFWRALRDELHLRRLALVLASPCTAPPDLDVEHLTIATSVDGIWPMAPDTAPHDIISALGLDTEALLAREAAWSGPAIVPAVERARRVALAMLAREHLERLEALAPVATLLWNGHHVTELILAAACRRGGTPLLYIERAPLSDSLFVDEEGLSTASRVARQRTWPASPAWTRRAAAIAREMAKTHATWWEQPSRRIGGASALRTALGIADEARVVLFAGQVDQDTQSFLFSPHHETNLAAFAWMLDQLKRYPDVYVLGKQHPRSRTPAARYQALLDASGVRGCWRSDVAIGDALDAADRVVAVNSTVLYEALARARPVLALGDWLLSGRGVAYEATRDESSVVDDWWRAVGHAAQRRRWPEALGHLLRRSVYSFETTGTRAGMLGAADLARRIARRAASSGWRAPQALQRRMHGVPRAPCCWTPDDTAAGDAFRRVDAWRLGHALRHTLLAAIEAHRQKRRVLVWGAGAGGQQVRSMLRAAGGQVDAFVTSTGGRNRTGPRTIAPRGIRRAPVPDFVVVATVAHADVIPQLTAMRLAPEADYVVVDTDALAALSGACASRDDDAA
jgi:hypothetical protein